MIRPLLALYYLIEQLVDWVVPLSIYLPTFCWLPRTPCLSQQSKSVPGLVLVTQGTYGLWAIGYGDPSYIRME